MKFKDVEIKNFKDLLYCIKIYYKRFRLQLNYTIYSNKSLRMNYLFLVVLISLFFIILIAYFFAADFVEIIPEGIIN
jgi:hypothetical protein